MSTGIESIALQSQEQRLFRELSLYFIDTSEECDGSANIFFHN